MNDCEFIGNLTKDPVIRNTKTGKAVASFPSRRIETM